MLNVVVTKYGIKLYCYETLAAVQSVENFSLL